MRDLPPPFRLDFRSLLQAWRRKLNSRVEGVSISLPFISFRVAPTDLEQRVARELIIRMANRRVLSASECCDNCIDQALESLQGIRSTLEEKQVERKKGARLEFWPIATSGAPASLDLGSRGIKGVRHEYFCVQKKFQARIAFCW